MDKLYKSTRGKQKPIDFYTSILQGLGDDGGLLVPDFDFEKKNLKDLKNLNYVDLATEIISSFTDETGKEDMRSLIHKAYNTGLFDEEIAPVKKVGDLYVCELFHGQTAAFKDMALSLLPHFMTYSLQQKGEKRDVMILAATSGDTGKAALEGFKNVKGTEIKVFYPLDGVSRIQKQQMVTTTGDNVEVIGIRGNFDDAQRAVKEAFSSPTLKDLCEKHHVFLSSANSINIGRLLPQIVYYFYAYFSLVNDQVIKLGEEVNFTVPSGNFGNCLAGWIAKEMGLPVHRFIIASNKNNILTDFFKTGLYDIRREFFKTNAPAMDILVSSNLERLVYFMSHRDALKIHEYMKELNETGIYRIDEELLKDIQKEFQANYLDENEILDIIRLCFNKYHYLLDTHTAVGYGVYLKYRKETNDTVKTILLSTASPYKFPESVYEALTGEKKDVYEAIDQLYEKTGVMIPEPLKNMKDKEILHQGIINKEDILNFIGKRIEEH